ncbi:MAG: hypothetical protein JOS17DRAFT_729395 [Linnemannia elongata]|nr:MAG: hypothetical protein JOS17DRAFT_729395 [Linnemannia elongata]
MTDSPPSAPVIGSRSRPITISNTLSSGLAPSFQPRYSSPVRALLPAYHPHSPSWTPKNKVVHLQKNLPTPGVSSVTSRGSSLRQKGRNGDPPQGGRSRSTPGADNNGGTDGSVDRSQSFSLLSLSPLLAEPTPEQSCLIDKISTLTSVIGEIQRTFDDHIQSIKHNEDRTLIAVEEASMKAVERIQLKTEELVEVMLAQTEKTILQHLDGSLQGWNKVLPEQLRASTDDVQDLVPQASTSHSTTSQDEAANIRRTFEDCFQRIEEQIDQRIVGQAIERVITLAEDKGQEMLMSMVAQTEKVVHQHLKESLQNWTETLAGQLRAAVDTMQDQVRRGSSGQRPTPQQDMNEWRTQCDARISNEITDLKTAIAALNASTQQNQKLFQEQVRLTRNLNQQDINGGRGSRREWITPMSHNDSLSPTPAPRDGQAHPSRAGEMRQNDEHGATSYVMQSSTLPSTVVSLFNRPSIVTTTPPNNPDPEQKATAKSSTKCKRAQGQKWAQHPTTNTSGLGRQNLESAEEFTPRPLSAVAKGKQVMRREEWPKLRTGTVGSERHTQAPALMSKIASSANLTTRPSTLTTAPSLSESDTHGDGYVIIQGMSDSAFAPKVAKRERSRPSTNGNQANVTIPSDGPGTPSKRVKIDSATVTLGTAAAPIKIEDILKLPSRVTRSNRKSAQTEIVHVDLETVARRCRETGIVFKLK